MPSISFSLMSGLLATACKPLRMEALSSRIRALNLASRIDCGCHWMTTAGLHVWLGWALARVVTVKAAAAMQTTAARIATAVHQLFVTFALSIVPSCLEFFERLELSEIDLFLPFQDSLETRVSPEFLVPRVLDERRIGIEIDAVPEARV